MDVLIVTFLFFKKNEIILWLGFTLAVPKVLHIKFIKFNFYHIQGSGGYQPLPGQNMAANLCQTTTLWLHNRTLAHIWFAQCGAGESVVSNRQRFKMLTF